MLLSEVHGRTTITQACKADRLLRKLEHIQVCPVVLLWVVSHCVNDAFYAVLHTLYQLLCALMMTFSALIHASLYTCAVSAMMTMMMMSGLHEALGSMRHSARSHSGALLCSSDDEGTKLRLVEGRGDGRLARRQKRLEKMRAKEAVAREQRHARKELVKVLLWQLLCQLCCVSMSAFLAVLEFDFSTVAARKLQGMMCTGQP